MYYIFLLATLVITLSSQAYIKSVYNKSGPKLKQSSKDNKINDINDYNDSYEDYLINPEISLNNKL